MNNNTPFEKQNNELNYFEETTYKLRPGNIREIKQMNSSEMQSLPCKQLIIKNTQTCIGHYLEDEGAMEISKLFNKTRNLSQLGIFLYKNKITDVGFLEILKGMKQLPNLDSLLINMSFNRITDKGLVGFKGFFESQQQLKQLEIIFKKQINMTPQGCLTMCDGIKQCQLLKHLNLDFQHWQIDGDQIPDFGQIIQELKHLEFFRLNLENNSIEDSIMIPLCLGLKQVQSLKQLELNFRGNQLSLDGFITLFENIQFLSKLEYLKFDISQGIITFQYYNGQQLSKAFNQLNHLKYLSMNLCYNESFDKKFFADLGLGLSYLKKLEKIYLSLRKTIKKDYGAIELFQGLSTLKELQELYLDFENNELRDSDIQEFIKSLKKIKKLKKLYLNFKFVQISYQNIDYLFNVIGGMTQLNYLALIFKNPDSVSYNSQAIEKALQNLTNLEYLQLELEGYKIKNNCLISLGNGLKKLSSLKSLSLFLKVKDITQKGFLTINSSINEMEKLESLELCYKADYNDLKPNILQGLQLPESLQELCLQIQNQKENNIQVFGFKRAFKNLQNLKKLFISMSSIVIQDYDLFNLGQSLKSLENLESIYLYLDKTNLQDLQVWDIMEGIKRLEKLRYLYFDFSYNQIGKLHDVLQSEGLKGLKYLHHVTINLNFNKITNDSLSVLGKFLANLPCLKTLSLFLDENLFDYEGLTRFKESVQNFKQLTKFTFVSMHKDFQTSRSKQTSSDNFIKFNLMELNKAIKSFQKYIPIRKVFKPLSQYSETQSIRSSR